MSLSQAKKKFGPIKNNIFIPNVLTKHVFISINNIGGNLSDVLLKTVTKKYEGKCIDEGYIKNDSIRIITYSSGQIIEGTSIKFEIVFECLICFPVEGMQIECVAANITKAGIKAILPSYTNDTSPLIIFIARDHEYKSEQFALIKENMVINVKVIGQRFELNDTFISVIAELLKPKKKAVKKPKLILED